MAALTAKERTEIAYKKETSIITSHASWFNKSTYMANDDELRRKASYYRSACQRGLNNGSKIEGVQQATDVWSEALRNIQRL